MTTVVVVADAESQLGEILEWWNANRSAALDLPLDEFVECVALLEKTPDAGLVFRRATVVGVRRFVMQKTRHIIYYLHDSDHDMVDVIAVWGGLDVLRDTGPRQQGKQAIRAQGFPFPDSLIDRRPSASESPSLLPATSPEFWAGLHSPYARWAADHAAGFRRAGS
jgi:plasmid stabilization system protein ParE